MTTLAYVVPTAGSDLNATADPEIATALNTIKTWANGNVDAVNLSALLAQSVGANQNTQVVKGASNISTSESRTNVAFGTMPTPDQVTGLVLPTNGLIAVWYQATWQESVAGAANIAIFVGSNQLVIASGSSAGPQTVAAAVQGGAQVATNRPIATCAFGLVVPEFTAAYTGDLTTGQAVGVVPGASTNVYFNLGGTVTQGTASSVSGLGGPCYIFAAAGTYTVSVQFKASSGSVTASNRKLWVQALSFA